MIGYWPLETSLKHGIERMDLWNTSWYASVNSYSKQSGCWSMHTNKRVTNLLLRFILFKWVLSYVTQYFNQSKGLNMLRFNLDAKKLVVIETAVTDYFIQSAFIFLLVRLFQVFVGSWASSLQCSKSASVLSFNFCLCFSICMVLACCCLHPV